MFNYHSNNDNNNNYINSNNNINNYYIINSSKYFIDNLFDFITAKCLSTVSTGPLGPSCNKGSASTWDHWL